MPAQSSFPGLHAQDLQDDSTVLIRIWKSQHWESKKISIAPELIKHLHEIPPDPNSGKLFRSLSRLEQVTKTYAQKAGIIEWRHIRPQMFRRPSKLRILPKQFWFYRSEFEPQVIKAAQETANFYILNYCIENTVRRLISRTLETKYGSNWWSEKVSQTIRDKVKMRQQQESDSPMSIRSNDPLAYTMFLELMEIIDDNWQDFSNQIRSRIAMKQKLLALNGLRTVVAHNVELNDREKKRFEIYAEDWLDLSH